MTMVLNPILRKAQPTVLGVGDVECRMQSSSKFITRAVFELGKNPVCMKLKTFAFFTSKVVFAWYFALPNKHIAMAIYFSNFFV